MLITLVKIANKLDSLGEHGLATELDTVIQELAAYAEKSRDKLLDDLKEVTNRLEDDKTSPERLKELNEVRENIEKDLAVLDDEEESNNDECSS